jgi:hypothetical protein
VEPASKTIAGRCADELADAAALPRIVARHTPLRRRESSTRCPSDRARANLVPALAAEVGEGVTRNGVGALRCRRAARPARALEPRTSRQASHPIHASTLVAHPHPHLSLAESTPGDTAEYIGYQLKRAVTEREVFDSDPLALVHEQAQGRLRELDRSAPMPSSSLPTASSAWSIDNSSSTCSVTATTRSSTTERHQALGPAAPTLDDHTVLTLTASARPSRFRTLPMHLGDGHHAQPARKLIGHPAGQHKTCEHFISAPQQEWAQAGDAYAHGGQSAPPTSFIDPSVTHHPLLIGGPRGHLSVRGRARLLGRQARARWHLVGSPQAARPRRGARRRSGRWGPRGRSPGSAGRRGRRPPP